MRFATAWFVSALLVCAGAGCSSSKPESHDGEGEGGSMGIDGGGAGVLGDSAGTAGAGGGLGGARGGGTGGNGGAAGTTGGSGGSAGNDGGVCVEGAIICMTERYPARCTAGGTWELQPICTGIAICMDGACGLTCASNRPVDCADVTTIRKCVAGALVPSQCGLGYVCSLGQCVPNTS